MSFFDKELSKSVMTRTKLRSNFQQNKNEENRKLYAKEGNFCVSLYKILIEEPVIGNKIFWEALKPFLSDKIVDKNKIYLTENGELIRIDLELAEIL